MPIDWKAEKDLTWRIWKWWMRSMLIFIPFGVIYAATLRALGHDSHLALGICIVFAIGCNFIIQGMPPEK